MYITAVTTVGMDRPVKSVFQFEAFQNCFRNSVSFLFVKDGNIESAAVIFGQEVTVQTGFSFTVPFNLGSVELRGFERLDSRLVADLVIVGDVFQFITQFVPLETFTVQQLDSDVISIVTDDVSFFRIVFYGDV